ncbi:Rgg/GadR/MutR family transcriptional regulator [Lactobacillus helveticus]|uniref:helix-turn-helix domain-containing protein n=1 Tax=Lactobacillus helveticus TaxID=1587 RepID=UPI001C64B081|nr:Rgg/GadR/MutR family transcriptional regulator [Lactobacillus helveticus]MBW8012993.1 Rgg/GadR/MutR family transcriptional regulator [Lactobacillus helveticus]
MKSTFGKTLRKIRKNKQVSICSISDENLSKSQISRFERGESEISCIRLINILDKLNISIEEFMIVHNDDSTRIDKFTKLVQYIRKAYSEQRLDNIIKLLSNSSKYPLNNLEKTMVKSIIHTLDSRIKPEKNEIVKLVDYLFKVEYWGYYEIMLLGNCARTIEYTSFFLLTKEMLLNFIYSSLHKNNKRLVTQLAINCLILSIEKNNVSNCTYLIKEIEKLLDNELNYYEQTVFLYATGYFEFKLNQSSGIEKMKNAIQVFDILGENKIKAHYTEHYAKFVNK